jgi:hypothetical protein
MAYRAVASAPDHGHSPSACPQAICASSARSGVAERLSAGLAPRGHGGSGAWSVLLDAGIGDEGPGGLLREAPGLYSVRRARRPVTPSDDEVWQKGLSNLLAEGERICKAPILERYAPDLVVLLDAPIVPASRADGTSTSVLRSSASDPGWSGGSRSSSCGRAGTGSLEKPGAASDDCYRAGPRPGPCAASRNHPGDRAAPEVGSE